MEKPLHSFAGRLTKRIILLWILMMSVVSAIVFFKAKSGMSELADIHYGDVLDLTNEKVQGILRSVEVSAVNIREGVEQDLSSPDAVYSSLERELGLNAHLQGCAIAFVADYFPSEGPWFEPSVSRSDDGIIERRQLSVPEQNYYDSPLFHTAITTGKDLWLEPHPDRSGAKMMLCSYSTPIQDKEDHIVGVLRVDASLDWLTEQMHEIDVLVNERDRIPDDATNQTYSFLLDRDGDYIAHPDPDRMLRKNYFDFSDPAIGPDDTSYVHIGHAMLAGEKGREETVIEKVPSYVYFAPIEKTGWSVGIVVPRSALVRSGLLQGLFLLGLMFLSMLVITLASRFMIKRTTKPLQHLARSAHEVAKGDFNTPLPEIVHHDEIRQLRDSFADMETSLAEYVRVLTETTAQKASLESELSIAREIQMSMLPNDFTRDPECNDLDIYASMTPAKAVGGDFYDFLLRDGRLYFCIGDVSGKGVPAALVVSILSTQFRSLSSTEDKPEKIVSAINDSSKERNASLMFATLFVGILDPATGALSFCNAGHNAPILMGTEPRFLEVTPNLPVGVETGWDYKGQQLSLAPGMTLLLYTDGLPEAENADQDLFGEQRVLDTLKGRIAENAETMVQELTDAVHRFVGEAEQSDDLTLLAIRLPKQTA